MEKIFYPNQERGHVNFGWLDSHHSFSFGHWYDPSKVHFGALRVINDDIVRGGGGFGTHPHDNMEIISIPLHGALAHQDSTGTAKTIQTGDVQIMSAGTGIQHSEFNASAKESVNFLQIWIYPKAFNIHPRYDQKTFLPEDRKNRWQVVVSPLPKEGGVWINQDARIARADLDAGRALEFPLHFLGNGLYCFVLEGSVEVEGQILQKRDALGISGLSSVKVSASVDSQILVLEVPMELPKGV